MFEFKREWCGAVRFIIIKENGKSPSASQGSIKTFSRKIRYAKKLKQNRPLPNWVRYKTDNTIR